MLKRVPLVLHEQNSVPGLANRVLSRWARRSGRHLRRVAQHLAHPERGVVTGNPVREAVLVADRLRGRAAFGLDAEATVLLVFGGSRGARHINDTLVGSGARTDGGAVVAGAACRQVGLRPPRWRRASQKRSAVTQRALQGRRLYRRHGRRDRGGRCRRFARGRYIDRRDHGDRARGGPRAVSVCDGRSPDAERARCCRGRRCRIRARR